MPRPIITNNISTKVETNVNNQLATKLQSGVASDRVLLKKRSHSYIKYMTKLDPGQITESLGFIELIEKLKEEFGILGINEFPLGIVSKCYLGYPHEAHILDLTGSQIIEHYKKGEILPGTLERARTLAMHNSYVMIEVYASKMILVREDGSTSKL